MFPLVIKLLTVLYFLVMLGMSAAYLGGPLADPLLYEAAMSVIPESSPVLSIVRMAFISITSLTIILVLRFTVGEMEIEMTGVKFKGASCPVILWMFCTIALGIITKA